MKAVLVIDMPNDADISKVRIGGNGNIYYIREGERASIVGNIRNIKPLPQKNKYDVEKYATVDYENDITLEHYLNKGWNDCLDTIMGSNMAHRWEKE